MTGATLLGIWIILLPVVAAAMGPVVATAKDDGRTLTLHRGQELQLTLQSNRTTGYSWTVARAGRAVLAQAGEPIYQRDGPEPGAAGAGGSRSGGSGRLTSAGRRSAWSIDGRGSAMWPRRARSR